MKTPLHAWHVANGGKMIDFGDWEMPIQYSGGIIKEHLATRRFGGLFDVSHMGRFRISGKETLPFLQYVLTNDAENLAVWQAQYTLIANQNGGLLDDAYLFRPGPECPVRDDYFLVVNASNREKDWKHFQEVAENFAVSLEDQTAQVAMIALQGPLAEKILSAVMESGSLPKAPRNTLAEITILDTTVLASRTGYTGEPLGFELFVAATKVVAIWELLEKTGRKDGLLAVGLGARDTLRLEAGMPLYDHEFGLDPDGREIPAYAFPLTSYAVKFGENKSGPYSDFIGRAALLAQFEEVQKIRAGTYQAGLTTGFTASEILPRRIFPLALRDGGVARQGDPVFCAAQKVGVITSGTMVPYWKSESYSKPYSENEDSGPQITNEQKQASHRRALAFAYVDATLKAGQEVEVEVRSRRLKAQLVRRHGHSNVRPYFQPVL